MDVESEESIKSCFSSLFKRNKKIDILYNNAGIIDWNDLNNVDASVIEKNLQRKSYGCSFGYSLFNSPA